MKNKLFSRALIAFYISCISFGCAKNDNEKILHDASGLDKNLTDEFSIVESCSFSEDYACWKCSNGTFGKDYSLACKKENDCQVFCGTIPPGYKKCQYGGPGESEKLCNNWPTPKRGTFSGCRESGETELDGASYLCPYCLTQLMVVTFAVSPEGKCIAFATNCIPYNYNLADGQCRYYKDAGLSTKDAGY